MLDVSGMVVVPGLIDLHVHLCHEPRAHFGVVFSHGEDDEMALLRCVQNLSELLVNGVCLVRDLGGRDVPMQRLVEISRSHTMILPEVESAGAPFCLRDGHGYEFGREAPPVDLVASVLRAHRASGHTWAKVMNGPEIWEQEHLVAFCSAAHQEGLKVAVHTFSDEGVRGAIAAQADTVEHCFASCDEIAAAAASGRTAFVPTAFAARTSLASSFACTMDAIETGYCEDWQHYLNHGVVAHQRHKLPAFVGTDAGCAPCQAQDVVNEMVELEDRGFDPVDVLEWATRSAADILGRGSDFGAIEPGRMASFLVVDADPRESAAHLKDPALVLAKGAPVRDQIGACLA